MDNGSMNEKNECGQENLSVLSVSVSVECGVWSVSVSEECGVWSVECECGVWSVECGVWSVDYDSAVSGEPPPPFPLPKSQTETKISLLTWCDDFKYCVSSRSIWL